MSSKGSSKSTRSSCSKFSTKTAALLEKAKLMELKLEGEFLTKKKEVELQSARLKNELQIAIAESKLKVYSDANEIRYHPSLPAESISKPQFVQNYVDAHSEFSHNPHENSPIEYQTARAGASHVTFAQPISSQAPMFSTQTQPSSHVPASSFYTPSISF